MSGRGRHQGFLAAGVKLESALLARAGWIKKLLIASVVITALDIVLVAAVLGVEIAQSEMTRGVIGLAITVYLLHNVTRLSAEAKRHGVPPEPPQARVVR